MFNNLANKQFNCPVCNEYVNKDELKPCSFLGQKSVGDNKLSYILRIRSAGSNIVYDSQTLK